MFLLGRIYNQWKQDYSFKPVFIAQDEAVFINKNQDKKQDIYANVFFILVYTYMILFVYILFFSVKNYQRYWYIIGIFSLLPVFTESIFIYPLIRQIYYFFSKKQLIIHNREKKITLQMCPWLMQESIQEFSFNELKITVKYIQSNEKSFLNKYKERYTIFWMCQIDFPYPKMEIFYSKEGKFFAEQFKKDLERFLNLEQDYTEYYDNIHVLRLALRKRALDNKNNPFWLQKRSVTSVLVLISVFFGVITCFAESIEVVQEIAHMFVWLRSINIILYYWFRGSILIMLVCVGYIVCLSIMYALKKISTYSSLIVDPGIRTLEVKSQCLLSKKLSTVSFDEIKQIKILKFLDKTLIEIIPNQDENISINPKILIDIKLGEDQFAEFNDSFLKNFKTEEVEVNEYTRLLNAFLHHPLAFTNV